MTQDDVPAPESPTEIRIREALKNHPQLCHLGNMAARFKAASTDLQTRGAHHDMVATAAVTHLSAMLAAMKMASLVAPQFIDLLLDDLVDSVRNRAIVGETKFHTKQ